MKILRVHYKHPTDDKVTNTYFDIDLSPNQEKVTSCEVMEMIPEKFKVVKHLV